MTGYHILSALRIIGIIGLFGYGVWMIAMIKSEGE